ncbi:MAG: PIN domain-containing protein [Candidatus Aenigmatarchaeota archaeon]
MLLDTHAWVEFFNGSEKGKKVKKILEEKRCFTSIVSLAEIAECCLRCGETPEKFVKKIKELSTILTLDEATSVSAGKINFYRKKVVKNWGMLDSFILASSLVFGLKIVTGDLHFKDLPNVVIL